MLPDEDEAQVNDAQDDNAADSDAPTGVRIQVLERNSEPLVMLL